MKQTELARSLLSATRIVKRFVSGGISAKEFVEEYSNFYHFEALDGHERSSAQDADGRAKYWLEIELHRRIQEEVINKLILESSYSHEELREAGRLDENDAHQRALEICAVVGLNCILENLGG